jgi:hypothetical protein
MELTYYFAAKKQTNRTTEKQKNKQKNKKNVFTNQIIDLLYVLVPFSL